MFRLIEKYSKQIDGAILILGFVFGANLFIFFRQSGIDETTRSIMFGRYGFHFLTPTIGGIVIGVTIFWLEYRFFKNLAHYDRRWIFVLKFMVISGVVVLSVIVLQTGVNIIAWGSTLMQALRKSWGFISSGTFLSLYVYLILLSITINFFRELGNRFGHGIIINYLIGKYREPVEEYRVFMFLDLNSSTAIAEELGHVKYSRFLNKCFSDLSEVLTAYDGEVYQYVGDEAVITWNGDQLQNLLNPILLFEAYSANLKDNSKVYLEKFGIFPTFKASIHCGIVSVTMVGGARKEMAFHGDVLNTASRILEQCTRLGKNLLITDSYAHLLKGNKNMSAIYMKDLFLRGKKDITGIYQPILN
ncbi:MAG: adenylate/guanylate cyclase domain-containing protein [Cytophagales bacterium]|nr:adenylate/guanylate cyclase domain-containing protein [Cytophagales bacterium]